MWVRTWILVIVSLRPMSVNRHTPCLLFYWFAELPGLACVLLTVIVVG